MCVGVCVLMLPAPEGFLPVTFSQRAAAAERTSLIESDEIRDAALLRELNPEVIPADLSGL